MLKRTLLALIIINTTCTCEAQRRGFFYWDEFAEYFSPCDSFNLFDNLNSEISMSYFKIRGNLDDSLTLEGLYRFKKLGTGFYRVYFNWHRFHFQRPEYYKFDSCFVWHCDKNGEMDYNGWKQARYLGENQIGMDSIVYLSTFFISKTDTFLHTNYKEFYLEGKVKERWTKEKLSGVTDFSSGNYRIRKFVQDSLGRNCQDNFIVDSKLNQRFLYRYCSETIKNNDGKLIESRGIQNNERKELTSVYISKYYYQGERLVRVEYFYNGVLDELLIFKPYNKKTHGRLRHSRDVSRN